MTDLVPLIGWTLGFVLTVASLAYTVRHFRISGAMSFIQRMNSPDMVEMRSAVNRWLDQPIGDREKFAQLSEDEELRVQLNIFLDIITELGIAYRYRSVSRKLVREIWYPLVPSYWDRLQFYAYSSQLKGHRTGYWFRYLAEEISASAASREKTLQKRYEIPEKYYSAAADAWLPTRELEPTADSDE
ncbi:MAG: hypothetical protein MJB57_05555 [Gemmatimonadetes bacterium]|nr:hypothetical protein [Gemmatimonadota bacterium]